MKCMYCENPATVHLTDIVNKKKREAHLCERCARERNLLPDPPGPPVDLQGLMGLLAAPHPAGRQAAVGEAACPECGISYSAFKAGGRFGCPHDYDAFRPALEPLLERVHRATAHAGKAPAAARRAARLAELRADLKAAVGVEDYEQAARLRDLIKRLETEGEGTPG